MAFRVDRSPPWLAHYLVIRRGSPDVVAPGLWQLAARTTAVSLASKALLTLVSVAHLVVGIAGTFISTRSMAQATAPPVVTPPPPAIALPIWPTAAPGKSPACTGQGCADRFRDGQSLGYEVLQWGVTNQSDPNRRNNLSTNRGARQDPTAQNPRGVMTTRDFMPGGATEAELNGAMGLQNLENLMAVSNAARDKVDEFGCRVTSFTPSTLSHAVLNVTAYITQKTLVTAATATTGAKYEIRRIATTGYGGSIPFSVSFFGATPPPVVRTITQATDQQNGLQLVLQARVLEQMNDAVLSPWRIVVDSTTAQITTVGTVKDNFTIRGTLNSLPPGGANVIGDIYLSDRRYYQPHTQPNGVCQPDPPSCVLRADNGQTASACSGSPFAGLMTLYDVKNKPATTDASQTLRTSMATNRTQVAGVDPEQYADNALPGSRNTLAGNPPTFTQQPGQTYKPFNFSVNERFSGCTDVRTTTLPGADTTRRTLDVQSCIAHLDPSVPRTCSGTRALGFTPIGNYEIGRYVYRTTTKTASCPPGTTLYPDMPPVDTGQWMEQEKNFRWSSCPAATPIYVGPPGPGWQTPVDYLYRHPDATGNAWGPWTPFSNVSSVCAASGTPTPAPADSAPEQVFGTPSVVACMPGRISTTGSAATTAPEPFTGTLNFIIRTMGASETVVTPVDPAPYAVGTFNDWQITYNRATLDAKTNFPHNLTVTAGSGSVSGLTVNTYGSADDGWTIVGSITAEAANDIRFNADLKYIAANDVLGCDDYMGMLADKVCTLPPPGQMTCTDNRGPSTTLNGVTFGTTGPLTGVTHLLKPWGVPATATVTADGPSNVANGPAENFVSEPMCFAVKGPQLSCIIQGSGSENWRNHFPAEQALKGYVDNCDTQPRNSTPTTTVGLLSDTACRYLGPGNCVFGATGAVSGTCYQREVLYDCGTTTVVGTGDQSGDTQIEQSCSSALRCIGTECHRPISETSQEFARVSSAGEILNAIRHHTVCAETGQEIQSDSQSCTPILFGGLENKCLSPSTAQVGVGGNCCQRADEMAAGVDFNKYITVLTLAWRLKDTQFAQSTLQAFGNLSGVTATYNNAANAVASTLKPITDSFASMMQSLGYSPTNVAVVAKDASLIAKDGVFNPLTEISTLFKEKVVELLGSVLEGLGLAGSAAAGQQLANQLISGVSAVLFWYGIAQLIGSLVYSCKADQLTPGLGMARKGGACHFLGTRTHYSIVLSSLERWSVYCCYASPLARIMQENFRNGLPGTPMGTSTISWTKTPFYGQALFGGWGDPGEPKCSGITPSQMLEVDWGKVDLSEWVNALKDNGLLPKTEAEVNKRYGLTANGTNTAFPNLGPGGTTTPQPGPDRPMDKPKAMQDFMAKYSGAMTGVVDTLNPQSVCYDDPTLMAWYAPPGPQSVTDIIEDLGGTGSYQSCGTGCVMVTLGTAQNDYFHDSCTQIYPQQQTFRVNRPDYILSAQITEANWDDHLQISVNDAPVYTSPSWYQSKPLGGNVCELSKSWRLNASTPCIGGSSCTLPSNSVPFIDITAQMKGVDPGGLVRTNTAVIVGGGGEGFARMRVLYTPPGPPPPLPTDPADPKYRKCYSPDGSKK